MAIPNLEQRQHFIFTLLAGLFLGTIGMVNLLGVSHFIDLSFTCFSWNIPIVIPVGALPYPCTFLCINVICELFGRQKANHVVYAGILINLWILFFIWVAGILPSSVSSTHDAAFYEIRYLTMRGVSSSMIAFIVAQLLDIHLFQYWRKLTKGKHLWLRSNASTLISQFVDTAIVVGLTLFLTDTHPQIENTAYAVVIVIFSSYGYKLLAAIFSTIPIYFTVIACNRYFQMKSLKPTSNFVSTP